jgi:redox-sensitive bicupin YhaK (pirin superfamily)
MELLEGRDVPLGRYSVVRRTLPNKVRRTVGAWCFLDHFGPEEVTGKPGMRVPPHPHIGLQTVTWLFDGEIRHRDSLGSDELIRPGQLNIMTSGHGIAHSEDSPAEKPPLLHGVQLWVALPAESRGQAPRFEHLPELPVAEAAGVRMTVAIGSLGGVTSPARVHSDLVGAEVVVALRTDAEIAIDPAFEHGVVVTDGAATVEGVAVRPGSLLHVPEGRASLRLSGTARLFVIGGVPLAEDLVMWWNFVARSHEEIVAAREDWAAGSGRFGVVPGGQEPLPAPALPTTRLLPRPRFRSS